MCGEKETFGESLKEAMTSELRGAEILVHFTIYNEGAWCLPIYIILKKKKKKVKKKGLLGSTFKGKKKTQVSQQLF